MSTREERIAEAVANTGSPEYTIRSGSTLDLLAAFAREGDLEGMSMAFRTYTALFPKDADQLAAMVPNIVSNQYFYLHLKLSQKTLMAWSRESSDWRELLSSSIGNDTLFPALVHAMAQKVRYSEAI